MDKIFWSKSSANIRIAVVELCGWCNKKGTATPMGKRIAKTEWGSLSAAAQNVLLNHGIQI